MESIEQVLLVNQDYRCVESYTRTDSGWRMDRIETGTVAIAECDIPLDEIYKNVRWD